MRVYGMTAQHYHSLVRLRGITQSVRADSGCIEGLVLESGYRSAKGAYAALRRLTSLTLAQVRLLSDSEFSSLMTGPLALPIAGAHR